MKKKRLRGAKAHASTGVEGSGKMINPESSKASVVYLVSTLMLMLSEAQTAA